MEPKNGPTIDEQLQDIRNTLHTLVHGNGRQGVHALLDDVYGPRARNRQGLFERVVLLEKEVQKLAQQRKESIFLQRGIAIGVGLVALDVVLGLDLTKFISAIFGAG